MRLEPQVQAVVMNRHRALRRAVDDVEEALLVLEANGGRVGEASHASQWGTAQQTYTRARVHATPPLRRSWSAYLDQLLSHLDREEALLPALAKGIAEDQVDAETVTRKITALWAEHEALRERTVEVRQAFLRVLPLLRAFTQLEEEFLAHVEAEEIGVYGAMLQCVESSLELDDTPTTGRYERVMDPTRELRETISQAAPVHNEDQPESWLPRLRRIIFGRRRIRY